MFPLKNLARKGLNGDLVKTSLKLGQGWVNTPHTLMWRSMSQTQNWLKLSMVVDEDLTDMISDVKRNKIWLPLYDYPRFSGSN